MGNANALGLSLSWPPFSGRPAPKNGMTRGSCTRAGTCRKARRPSPALANLTAFWLDCRLTGLAKSVTAVYTRYADDLAFSGGEEFDRSIERFSAHAASIALEEGFSVNYRKTRILRRGVRQHLAGITVNQKPNVRRQDIKLLEAILTNCLHHGPASQNRAGLPQFRAHLAGRVSYVAMVNPDRGERLQLFGDVD